MANQYKFLNLESLRGIAALFVALFHFNLDSHFNIEFVKNSWLMVDFFFVLSGFVISLNYLKRITNIGSLFLFQKKRFLRLYPLHILMLLVFLGIEISKYIVEVNFNIFANNRAFSGNDLSSFVANVFLLQNWMYSQLTWNYPSWSISAEFYTYAIFAFTVLLSKNSYFKVVVVSILVIVIAGVILFNKGMGIPESTGPIRCLYSFFIGVLTYIVFYYFNLYGKLTGSLTSIFFIVSSVVLVIQWGSSAGEYTVFIPIIFSLTILSLVATKETTIVNQVLANRFLVYLGTISYGIYMIHYAVWWFFIQTLRFVFHLPTELEPNGQVSLVFKNAYLADSAVILAVIVVVGLAHFSYKFVEMRFNQKK